MITSMVMVGWWENDDEEDDSHDYDSGDDGSGGGDGDIEDDWEWKWRQNQLVDLTRRKTGRFLRVRPGHPSSTRSQRKN